MENNKGIAQKRLKKWNRVGKYALLTLFVFFSSFLVAAFIAGNFGTTHRQALKLLNSNTEIVALLGSPISQSGLTFLTSVEHQKVPKHGWIKLVKMGLTAKGSNNKANVALTWIELQDQAFVTRLDIENQDGTWKGLKPTHETDKRWHFEALAMNLDAYQTVTTGFNLGYSFGWKDSWKKVSTAQFEDAALQGNALAQFVLSDYYFKGIGGVEKNQRIALELLEKAAESGIPDAQSDLGAVYLKGEIVKANYEKAFNLFQKAAQADGYWACHNLGVMYTHGLYVKKDPQEAFSWFLKASIGGISQAQVIVGDMYLAGDGTEKNYQKAFEWYEKAANGGISIAEHNLGHMYLKGLFVKKDLEKAFACYLKAAERGFENSMMNAGYMYENGLGVPQNLKEAYTWYMKAHEAGVETAFEKANHVKSQIHESN